MESVRDVPLIGWIADKVLPAETPKEQEVRQSKKRPKGDGVRRKKAAPKPRITRSAPSPSTKSVGGVGTSPNATGLPGAKLSARDLQIKFSNPFATRAEREKAVRQWLKIHPRPGEASLTPNEMAAFREAYALTETEKW